jgi:hypothetical protein
MAESMASWLVAPQCTKRLASASAACTRAVSASTSGIAMLADCRAWREIEAASKPSTTAALSVAADADCGIIPSRACARARAVSKASKDSSTVVSENRSARSSVVVRALSNRDDILNATAGLKPRAG